MLKMSFLTRWFSVAGAVGLSDWVWTRYISSVSSHSSIGAANWSVVVIVLGAYVVVSYVNDKRLIAAAALGAWIGTYLGT
jgi:hypothetical protein